MKLCLESSRRTAQDLFSSTDEEIMSYLDDRGEVKEEMLDEVAYADAE